MSYFTGCCSGNASVTVPQRYYRARLLGESVDDVGDLVDAWLPASSIPAAGPPGSAYYFKNYEDDLCYVILYDEVSMPSDTPGHVLSAWASFTSGEFDAICAVAPPPTGGQDPCPTWHAEHVHLQGEAAPTLAQVSPTLTLPMGWDEYDFSGSTSDDIAIFVKDSDAHLVTNTVVGSARVLSIPVPYVMLRDNSGAIDHFDDDLVDTIRVTDGINIWEQPASDGGHHVIDLEDVGFTTHDWASIAADIFLARGMVGVPLRLMLFGDNQSGGGYSDVDALLSGCVDTGVPGTDAHIVSATFNSGTEELRVIFSSHPIEYSGPQTEWSLHRGGTSVASTAVILDGSNVATITFPGSVAALGGLPTSWVLDVTTTILFTGSINLSPPFTGAL